jgi:hypothetical protein
MSLTVAERRTTLDGEAECYTSVAVLVDLCANRWDLLELKDV